MEICQQESAENGISINRNLCEERNTLNLFQLLP